MKKRSKRYTNWKDIHMSKPKWNLTEAIEILKKNKLENFDSTVNVNFSLNLNPKKAEHKLKGFYTLPYPPVAKTRIAVFTETNLAGDFQKAGATIVGGKNLIADIAKTKKAVFDVALATPEISQSLKKIAPILGPKKLMPTSKLNTIALDLIPIIQEFKKGKRKFFNDDSGNVHLIMGKISDSAEKLTANFNYLKNLVAQIKPENVKGRYLKSIHISGTMTPSFQLKIEK